MFQTHDHDRIGVLKFLDYRDCGGKLTLPGRNFPTKYLEAWTVVQGTGMPTSAWLKYYSKIRLNSSKRSPNYREEPRLAASPTRSQLKQLLPARILLPSISIANIRTLSSSLLRLPMLTGSLRMPHAHPFPSGLGQRPWKQWLLPRSRQCKERLSQFLDYKFLLLLLTWTRLSS